MTAWISVMLLVSLAVADDSVLELAKQRVQELRQTLRTDPAAAIEVGQDALRLAKQADDPTVLADARLRLGYAYFNTGQIESALTQCTAGLETARSIANHELAVGCMVVIGCVYGRQGQHSDAVEVFNDALDESREYGLSAQESKIMHNLAIVYAQKGELAKALDYDLQTLKMLDETDRRSVADTLINIGSIYSALGKHEKALEYMQRTLKLKEEEGDPRMIALALSNVGLAYASLDENDKARTYLERALVSKRALGDPISISATLHHLGYVFMDMGEFEKAEQHLSEAAEIRDENGTKHQLVSTLLELSRLHILQNDYEPALTYAQRSLNITNEIESPRLKSDALGLLAAIHEATGNPKAALDAYRDATEIQESLLDEKTRLQLGDLQGQIEALEKTREIELLQRDHQIEQLELKDQLWVRNAFITGLIGLGLLATIGILLRKRNAQAQLNLRLESMVRERTADLEQRTRELNRMHHRLLEAAHHAGRAEVAIDVVHHIGNSLNSVNTSASMIFERVRDRRPLALLSSLSDHLSEKTSDESLDIQPIAIAVSTLLDKLQQQNDYLAEEAQALTESIQALNTAIKAQHLHANINWLYEEVLLEDFFQQIRNGQRDPCRKHEISLDIDCRVEEPCTLQRIRLFRAVNDLVTYAISLATTVAPEQRRIELAANRVHDQIIVEVVTPHAEQTSPDLQSLESTEEIVREMGGTWSVVNQANRLGFQITVNERPEREANHHEDTKSARGA